MLAGICSTASAIRSLPLSLFGLGIPRFAGLAGETACLLSREHTYDFFEQHHPSLLSSTRDQWPVIAMDQREESGMQLDLSSARSLLPELHPLFLGGGDTTLLHGDPGDWTILWEERRNDRVQFRTPAAPGSRTITARATRRFIQQRWADG